MSGAPRSAYIGGEFIAVRRAAVEFLGSWEAAGVWHRICWRAERTGRWVATIAEIADDCYLSVERTKTALQRCRDAGWLASERASGKDRTLAWSPLWRDETKSDIPPDLSRDSPPTSLETEKTTTPPSPPSPDPDLAAVPATGGDLQSEFDIWWSHYPRKVAKPVALRAYRAARRTVSKRELWDATKRHLPDLESRPVDKVPHPSTWLNQRRWEDDPAHAAQPARSSGARNVLLDPHLMDSLPAIGGQR